MTVSCSLPTAQLLNILLRLSMLRVFELYYNLLFLARTILPKSLSMSFSLIKIIV